MGRHAAPATFLVRRLLACLVLRAVAAAVIQTTVLLPLMPAARGGAQDYDINEMVTTAVTELGRQRNIDELEIVLLSYNRLDQEVTSVRSLIASKPDQYKHMSFGHGTPLYEMLNAGAHAAAGEFTTITRPEDRLAHPTIGLKQRYMQSRQTCDTLSTAVYATAVAGMSFGSARQDPQLILHDKVPTGTLYPRDLFLWPDGTRMRMTYDRTTITGLHTMMHEAPMWRTALIRKLGAFNTSLPAHNDWEFFARAAVRGHILCHLTIPLQTYFTPPTEDHDHDLGIKTVSTSKQDQSSSHDELLVQYSQFVALRTLILNEVPLSGVEGSHVRMGQVLQALLDAGHSITYVSRDTAWSWDMAKWVERSRASGIRVIVGDHELKSLYSIGNFDMVIMAAWYWRCGASSIPDLATAKLGVAHSQRMVVLSDDIHWVRAQQQQLVESTCDLYTGPVKDRELRDYSRADMIVSVTEEDAKTMRPYLQNDASCEQCVRHIPVVAKQAPTMKGLVDSFHRRSTFLYVGSHHYGNQRAVHWLLDEMFPILRSLVRNAELHLVGADIWKDLAKNRPGVTAHGIVSDLTPFLKKARLMLIPNLVGGSGISTKTMLALENGIPFITTTLGVTGVNSEKTPGAFKVADDPRGFAHLAAHIYLHSEQWRAQIEAIRKHVGTHLSKTWLSAKVQEMVFTIVNNTCRSPRWTASSLAKREDHRLIRYQRQQQAKTAKEHAGSNHQGRR